MKKQKQKILINCTTELNSALAFIVFKLRYLIINNLFITLNCTCFSFPNRAPLQSVCGIFKSWELSLSVLTRLWDCGIPAMKKKTARQSKCTFGLLASWLQDLRCIFAWIIKHYGIHFYLKISSFHSRQWIKASFVGLCLCSVSF